MKKKTRFIIGELSWLSFNNRVLQEVYNEDVPLIERIHFLAIFSSNLDEFFRVRVADLTRYTKITAGRKLYHGEKPQKVLEQIHRQVKQQQVWIEHIYHNVLIPRLAEENIFILNDKQLSEKQGEYIKLYFKNKILPDLQPIILDGTESPLQIKDPSVNLLIVLGDKTDKNLREYALMEIPDNHSRFIILPGEEEKKYIILLDDVIRYCLNEVFGILGFSTFKAYTIKVTRDAELDLDNDLSLSVMENISKSLKKRKKGIPVRFTYDSSMPEKLLNYIVRKLKIKTPNIIPGGKYHNFKDFMNFPNIGGKHLEYPPTPPVQVPNINLNKSFLAHISKQDVLVSVPYQSFDYISYFLREASIDPEVTSIKITLYRLASKSHIINALINAAKNGKKVVTMVELKARFDEERNIYWTQELEEAGVQVIHSMPTLKIHSKICLVTKRNKLKGEEYYAMLGTGNYNEKTARIYTDYHYFTAKKRIISDLIVLFSNLEKNFIISGSYKSLLIAPLDLRRKLLALISKEILNSKKGIDSYIILKMNSLTDEEMIEKLYEAGKAGIKIKLIVRGMCSLIPHKKGLSENIETISIVDKFLEHARVFIFSNGGKEQIYLSSADMMTRNLDRRVEVTFPLLDQESKKIVRDMINIQLKDNVKARILDEQLSNVFKKKTMEDEPTVRSQLVQYEYFSEKYTRENKIENN